MSEIKLQKHPETGELIPEIWKDVVGYEELYKVSNYGRVKSLPRKVWNGRGYYSMKGKILTEYYKHGYAHVSLTVDGKEKQPKVHRLVCEAFHDNLENKPEVNHKNSIKDDNFYLNLEWTTSKENIHHAIKNGTFKFNGRKFKKGENHKDAKLTKDDVREIRKELKTDKPVSKIAKKYGVTEGPIYGIKKGLIWKHVK